MLYADHQAMRHLSGSHLNKSLAVFGGALWTNLLMCTLFPIDDGIQQAATSAFDRPFGMILEVCLQYQVGCCLALHLHTPSMSNPLHHNQQGRDQQSHRRWWKTKGSWEPFWKTSPCSMVGIHPCKRCNQNSGRMRSLGSPALMPCSPESQGLDDLAEC